jgi:preprotein translocase subunit SecA
MRKSKLPLPIDSSGFYHIVIPLVSADDMSSPNDSVSIRKLSENEAHDLSRQLRDVGRNQPCPCGSGRKHKKCCLAPLN